MARGAIIGGSGLARDAGPSAAACLLTGMGRDGAAGLLALRRAGSFTIAQDEASCVVFGIPREAIALGAALRVLPLGEIAPALARLAARPSFYFTLGQRTSRRT